MNDIIGAGFQHPTLFNMNGFSWLMFLIQISTNFIIFTTVFPTGPWNSIFTKIFNVFVFCFFNVCLAPQLLKLLILKHRRSQFSQFCVRDLMQIISKFFFFVIPFFKFGSRFSISESCSFFSRFVRVLPNSRPTMDIWVFLFVNIKILPIKNDNWDALSFLLGNIFSKHPNLRHWNRSWLLFNLDHGPFYSFLVMCFFPTRISL